MSTFALLVVKPMRLNADDLPAGRDQIGCRLPIGRRCCWSPLAGNRTLVVRLPPARTNSGLENDSVRERDTELS